MRKMHGQITLKFKISKLVIRNSLTFNDNPSIRILLILSPVFVSCKFCQALYASLTCYL